MNRFNYQKKLDGLLDFLIKTNITPSLLLHSCCAPCSSYVILYLAKFFKITVFYYNPNIYPIDEYVKRLTVQKNFINQLNLKNNKNNIDIIEGPYDNLDFYDNFFGLENEPERGKRCLICYKLRLTKTAQVAYKNNCDYFTTTLTVSPYKNADVINRIGARLELEYNIKYLYSDFKKKDGYKKSIELSSKYNLYRQHYCGCKFSIR